MIKIFFGTKRWAVWAYGGLSLILLVLFVQTYMAVLFNKWYGRFYNMMQSVEKYTLADFNSCLFYFVWLALAFMVTGTGLNWFTRHYSLAWREALTTDYIPRWLRVTKDIEGSSQRIQEDTFKFSQLVEGLGLQVARSIMTVIAFTPILWGLSKHVSVPLLGSCQGNLVYTVCIVASGGMLISWFVGWYLPGLEYNNQVVEAAFRKELVHGEDDKVDYCSIPTLVELFSGIKYNYKKLFLHYSYYDIWSLGYDQFLVIVPYLIAGPALFAQAITLGTLVQISNAFGKVQQSLSIFILNWKTITELRSIHKRLKEFEQNIKGGK